MTFLLSGSLGILLLSLSFYLDCTAQGHPYGDRGLGNKQTPTGSKAGPTTPGLVSEVPSETPAYREEPFAGSESVPPPSIDPVTYRKIDPGPSNPFEVESTPPLKGGFRWREATKQTLMFLAVQHGYALTQPKTQSALEGKFWKDYVSSVKTLRGWSDGGRFFTNYVAHPMQGSFVGYIQIQNDPKGMKQQFGSSGDYWRSRLKAMAWSAAWSTQFEIGPLSQASIGNVGLKGKQTYIDIVITPTVGTAWLIAEDAMDRYLVKRIERITDNLFVTIFGRMLLNPTRTVANVFRFKKPWHRDRPRAN